MQKDVENMVQWCKVWRLSLNPDKCFLIQFNPRSQTRQFNPRYFIEGKPILQKQQVKDLGILISEDLKFHVQVSEACKKAHREINRIRRCFISRTPNFLSNMYKLYVRPHLEYCVELWSPRFVGDISKMEKVQNKMTKLLHHGNILTPQERNNVLGITSHEQRRLRGDLINMFKNINNPSFFTLRNNERIRGNDKTIIVPPSNSVIKKHSFVARSVSNWNSLPNYVVNSQDLNEFKRNIDRYFN